ncbi:MAG: ChrR family anti-sigma-E factor [Novosphingobium sp.]|nr:ChrR family anti-sigma-E factor [Novosphingobium sp.]
MARYVAGRLPEPARVLVEAHLAISAANRPLVKALECAAGDELEDLEPVEMPDREARMAAIFASPAIQIAAPARMDDPILPDVLRRFVGVSIADIPWKTKMPGYREYLVGEVDGCEANLLWIKPGRKMPAHTHEGSEITLVLDGAFSDANGRYARGDIAVADDSIDHRPIAENDRPCICFAVTDAPLKLTGSYTQRLSDFLGR